MHTEAPPAYTPFWESEITRFHIIGSSSLSPSGMSPSQGESLHVPNNTIPAMSLNTASASNSRGSRLLSLFARLFKNQSLPELILARDTRLKLQITVDFTSIHQIMLISTCTRHMYRLQINQNCPHSLSFLQESMSVHGSGNGLLVLYTLNVHPKAIVILDVSNDHTYRILRVGIINTPKYILKQNGKTYYITSKNFRRSEIILTCNISGGTVLASYGSSTHSHKDRIILISALCDLPSSFVAMSLTLIDLSENLYRAK